MKYLDFSSFRGNAPRIVAIFALAAAIDAGHASIPKLNLFVPHALAEARFLCVLVAIAGAMIGPQRRWNATALKLASSLAVLCAFLAISAASHGAPDMRHGYIVDVIYLGLFGFLAVALISDDRDLGAFCLALILIAIPFVPTWYIIDRNTFTGFTTITYYRIVFFAFVGCTYFAIRGNRAAWLGAAIFLFLTMDSTSRSAAILAPVAIAYFCFVLAIRKPVTAPPPRHSALAHLALLAVVVAVFIPVESGTVVARLEQATVQTQAPPAERNMDGQALNNLFTFNDGTQRVRMAVRAVDMWKEHKLHGAGAGTYAIKVLNSAQTGFDTYRYPHNVSLEILYSTGLIGFALYGAILAAFLVVMHRSMLAQADIAALGCGAMLVLLTSHFAGDFYDMRMFWIFVIAGVATFKASDPATRRYRFLTAA